VQAAHGQKLDEHSRMRAQIQQDIEPLKALPAVVQQIARDIAPLRTVMKRLDDHESRIVEVEKRTGVRES
jgi:hypothetical protein